PKETETLKTVVGIVSDHQNTCPIRGWVHLVPECGTELCAFQIVHRKCQIGIFRSLESIGTQETSSCETRIAFFARFLKTNEVHIVCIEWHIEHFSIKLG